MPRGDGTGPMGMGPMTGRAAGFCAGFGAPGFANRYVGRGLGGGIAGRGGGRGWRNMYYATGVPGFARGTWGAPALAWANPYAAAESGVQYGREIDREQETEALKAQAGYLESTLKDIEKRIEELEKEEK